MSFRSNPLFNISSALKPEAGSPPAPLLKLTLNPDLSISPKIAPEAQASLSYAYIHTDAQLNAALDDLGAPERLYIDTEFQSFSRNSPVVLSLIQVSGGGHTYVIDAMELDLRSNARLVSLFGRDGVEWVMHDANQDVDHLCNTLNLAPPRRLFDTQVAWSLLSADKSISLLNLTVRLCDARLNKAHQAATFIQRPLSKEIISYAASDVPPLIVARAQLGARLRELKLTERLYAESHQRLSPRAKARVTAAAPEPITPAGADNSLGGSLRRAWLKYIAEVCSARIGVPVDAFLHPNLFSLLELYTLEGPDGDPLAELRPLLTSEEGVLFLRALEGVARETPLPSARLITYDAPSQPSTQERAPS